MLSVAALVCYVTIFQMKTLVNCWIGGRGFSSVSYLHHMCRRLPAHMFLGRETCFYGWSHALTPPKHISNEVSQVNLIKPTDKEAFSLGF